MDDFVVWDGVGIGNGVTVLGAFDNPYSYKDANNDRINITPAEFVVISQTNAWVDLKPKSVSTRYYDQSGHYEMSARVGRPIVH